MVIMFVVFKDKEKLLFLFTSLLLFILFQIPCRVNAQTTKMEIDLITDYLISDGLHNNRIIKID